MNCRMTPFLDVHSLVARADLAAIGEARNDGGVDSSFDVGIVEQDEGGLPTELKPDGLNGGRGGGEDFPSGSDAPRHGNEVAKPAAVRFSRSMFQPNLEAITTLSRKGLMASPRMRSTS